ncbi:addiction module protein [Scytonema sp. NUACC26]|uniref:addiction module protein n=1 Tax=Scytonema sp. NUACC26 TaxID=3140176 RepID=UPI0034DBF6ED
MPQHLTLPPGFEQLSKEQQIDYVQELWNLIVAAPDEVSMPDWHLEIVQNRISSQGTAQFKTWSEVKQRLLNKYHEQ